MEPDEKVQRRGLRQHGLHPPDAPHGVSQLRAQAQRDPVPHRRPGGTELRNHGIPVIGPPGSVVPNRMGSTWSVKQISWNPSPMAASAISCMEAEASGEMPGVDVVVG